MHNDHKHKPFVQEKPRYRPARYASRLKEELVELVPAHLKDPRLEDIRMLTIVSVEVTPDLKHASILFALMDQEDKAAEVQDALNQASGFLRRELMHRLNTKITPQLTFKYDKGFENRQQVDLLLKKISEERSKH